MEKSIEERLELLESKARMTEKQYEKLIEILGNEFGEVKGGLADLSKEISDVKNVLGKEITDAAWYNVVVRLILEVNEDVQVRWRN